MIASLPIRIAVAGALGRMGRAVVQAVEAQGDIRLASRFDRDDASEEGLISREAALQACDVVIDFTSPQGSVDLASACLELGRPALVIGSTGFSAEQDAALRQAAQRVAMVRAGNFSLGVNLLLGLVRQAARTLSPADYDIEVLEAHHRRKVDAPSGTALMLGAAAAQGRGVELAAASQTVRDGITGARSEGVIGVRVAAGRRDRGGAQRDLRRRGRDHHPVPFRSRPQPVRPRSPGGGGLGRRQTARALQHAGRAGPLRLSLPPGHLGHDQVGDPAGERRGHEQQEQHDQQAAPVVDDRLPRPTRAPPRPAERRLPLGRFGRRQVAPGAAERGSESRLAT